MQHQLIKNDAGWYCEACKLQWKGKPRAECPGVPYYNQIPSHLKTERDLNKENLKPTASPVGVIRYVNNNPTWLYDPTKTEQLYPYPIVRSADGLKSALELRTLNLSTKGVEPRAMHWDFVDWQLLYDPADCSIIDPELPPIYPIMERPEHLKSSIQLVGLNLRPGKAKAVGCYWHPTQAKWIFLYDPDSEGFELLDPSMPPCCAKDNLPENLIPENLLKALNLKLREGATPKAHYRQFHKHTKYKGDWLPVFCYAKADCEIVNPDLPPCYRSDNYPDVLMTLDELKDLNLAPKEGSIARGCYFHYDRPVWLYHLEDCEWNAPDHYICKTTLNRTYLLSQRWIDRIGEPDKIVDNPHHEKFAPMKLYSRKRVEAFLAENAEEYALWLFERDTYVAIFEQNREAIAAGAARAKKHRREHREQLREQQKRCLQCASGCAFPKGFLCAVHPLGLESHQIPCPDWQAR